MTVVILSVYLGVIVQSRTSRMTNALRIHSRIYVGLGIITKQKTHFDPRALLGCLVVCWLGVCC